MTINDKHLERHENRGGDQPLAGAQITKSEDSALKQRQELLDGLKSHRITKDGNAFTIDMGDGQTVQDVRAAKNSPPSVEQQAGFSPAGQSVRYVDRSDAFPVPVANIGTGGMAPGFVDRSDVFPVPAHTDGLIGPDGKDPAFADKTRAHIMPGEGDYMPHSDTRPAPPGGDLQPPKTGDWSPIPASELAKLTIKTDTAFDKSGRIVTTETRADGSSFATTQAIGADSQLHVVSKEYKDIAGGTFIEKFDPATGRKTEEINDTGSYRVDTKYNSNGDPVTRDTTGGITGRTDHEEWLRLGSNNDLVIHLKNGVPDEPLLLDKNSFDTAKDRGGVGDKITGALNASVLAVREMIDKKNQSYFLSDYNPPGGPHIHYDFATYTWKDTQNKQAMPPPEDAYPAPNKDALEDAKYKNVRNRQYTCDQLQLVAYAASHGGMAPGQK